MVRLHFSILFFELCIASLMRCNCMQQIVVGYGLRKLMMLELGVTYPTIKAALEYKSNTYIAECIRQYALEHGGVLVKEINHKTH